MSEGHTLDLHSGGPYLVNPGSVGQPRDGDTFASYVIADGERVTYRFVEYDIRKAQAKIRAAGLPDARGPPGRGPLVLGRGTSLQRLFTVEEANALLPSLREILDEAALHRDALREKARTWSFLGPQPATAERRVRVRRRRTISTWR